MSLLSITDLDVSLGDRPVLHGVSLALEAGEFVGLIGPNGAGKSTLLRAALGLVRGTGTIAIAGRNDPGLAQRAREIAYLPQERDIAWSISVERLVALGRTPHRSAFAGPDRRDGRIVAEAMRRMGIESFRLRPVSELSGGEKARVLIARALAQDAPLLLADEPVAGLDPAHQIALMQLFRALAGEGRSVMASTHDLGLAARWCTRLILLDRGRIVADGPPPDVLTQERLRAVYGIEAYLGQASGGMVLQPLDLAPPAAGHRKE